MFQSNDWFRKVSEGIHRVILSKDLKVLVPAGFPGDPKSLGTNGKSHCPNGQELEGRYFWGLKTPEN